MLPKFWIDRQEILTHIQLHLPHLQKLRYIDVHVCLQEWNINAQPLLKLQELFPYSWMLPAILPWFSRKKNFKFGGNFKNGRFAGFIENSIFNCNQIMLSILPPICSKITSVKLASSSVCCFRSGDYNRWVVEKSKSEYMTEDRVTSATKWETHSIWIAIMETAV